MWYKNDESFSGSLSHIFRIMHYRIWTANRLYRCMHFVLFSVSKNNFYLIILKKTHNRKENNGMKYLMWTIFGGSVTCSWNFPLIVDIVMSSWIINEVKSIADSVFYLGKWTPWIKFHDILRISNHNSHCKRDIIMYHKQRIKKNIFLTRPSKEFIRNTVS